MTDPLTLWRAAAWAEPSPKLYERSQDADLATQLVNYIAGTAGHFPVHDALLAFDRACRRRHARWPDHRGRPVCSEMVRLVIFGGASLLYCADHYEISYPRAERLLSAACDFMRQRQERWLADTGMSAGHEPEYCRVCRGEAA